MTDDTPKKALKEAEAWIASAKHILTEAQSDETISGVCCAQAIHGLIRANDALTMKFSGVKTTRHDDAPFAFAKICRDNKISKSDAEFKNVLAKAMRDKSGADYGKKAFTYAEAKWYVEKAEEFAAMAAKYV